MAEPKVRFKKDDGSNYPAWTIVPFSKLSVPSGIKNKNDADLESYSISNDKGFVPQNEQFEDAGYLNNADRSLYYIVSPGSFAYNPARINIGSIGYQNVGKDVLVSSLYEIFNTTDELDDGFLMNWFKTEQFQKHVRRLSEGGVRQYFYYDKLRMVKFSLPCLEEQQKIADFLSSVDEVISTSEQEVANLETQKMAVMKKIFTQEVRFKRDDGTEFPEWEEKLLSDVSECLDNQRVPINATERAKIPGEIPYYGAGSIQGFINKYLFDEELVLLLEDGDAFDDFKTKSISQFVTGKCWINNHAHVLRPLEEPFFLHCALSHKDIRAWTQLAGQSRKKLTQDNMLRITLKMPCLEEQRLIACFLSDFDEAIVTAKKEVELWKELKKGLLQQMFV